ncbi:hypothetical protein DSECCO2_539400 [anaerobic digester metagenome]
MPSASHNGVPGGIFHSGFFPARVSTTRPAASQKISTVGIGDPPWRGPLRGRIPRQPRKVRLGHGASKNNRHARSSDAAMVA